MHARIGVFSPHGRFLMATRPPATRPRLLLRQLREVMASGGAPEARLQTVVRVIAANMVAEVCSIYLLRAGEVLELFATEGLKFEAVHVTRLRVGEGLVGDIAAHARPLNLADAQSHPQFAYKPETGEEVYHSLMGVPILRSGRVIGVVVVQNRTRRRYSEEEVEALETVAMVLAELVGSAQLIGRDELARVDGNATLPLRLDGRMLSEGMALGVAVLHEPRIEVARTIAEDVGLEKQRLDHAVCSLRASLDMMLEKPELADVSESRDIIETYKMFAHDSGWLAKLNEAVEGGLTAEAAALRVQTDTRHRMQSITDPYLRERLADLDDLAHRLLLHLSGRSGTAARESLPEDAVLFARAMGPAELLDYDRTKLRGVVLEEGSPTSHVAIVARALAIPVIGHCEEAVSKVDPGDAVIVDADHAQVFVRPGEDVLQAFRQNAALREARQAKYAALRHEPAVTRSGERIFLNMNAGLLVDLAHLEETGADGVGLYRTELQFMIRASFPKVEAQTDLYSKVLDQSGGRAVVFRTLDIGGDKILPYVEAEEEENPAMGWRAIRIALDRPALLRSQVRALLQAGAGRPISLMFPMVSEVAEFVKARDILDREVDRLRGTGRALPSRIRVGTMLEVPALAWQLPALLPLTDFISVGSNDLWQFLFATDRGNPRLADRYDPLSPAMLGFLRWVVSQCDRAGVPVALCGEMAGRPIEAMALIGAGFRNLSMPAASIGPVKEMLRSLSVPPLVAYMDGLYALADHSLRGRLQNFAQDHGIVI
ncbi:MAG TPA: phosphoenolpyruvate--protein phosphotransferase [Candidatus Cybelea sp.]|nr:phosphoenolpyruvate--protein phosphotransferase [Candidatus Cybelea sp.]